MFCSKCGTEIKPGFKFCPKCGSPAQTPPAAPAPQPTSQPAPQPAAQPAPQKAGKKAGKKAAPAPQPTPQPAAKPAIDVKKIVKKPPEVVSLKETLDFKGAENALEAEALKVNAFAGFFSRPQPSEVRVDSLTKIYEPIHRVRALYEGKFEIAKDFTLPLDPGTVEVVIDGKSYKVEPSVAQGGIFGGGSGATLKLTGVETVDKRAEKAVYFNMNGVENTSISNYVKGDTVAFDSKEAASGRSQVLGTNFDASDLTDRVLTPDIVQRPQNSKKTVSEQITVEVQTVYFPKYKALVTNLKNSQQRYLIFSAVDKQILSSESF